MVTILIFLLADRTYLAPYDQPGAQEDLGRKDEALNRIEPPNIAIDVRKSLMSFHRKGEATLRRY